MLEHVVWRAGGHELDEVVDRVTRLNMTARRIDVDLDRLRAFLGERQDSRHYIARQLSEDLGIKLENVTLDMLGKAKKVRIEKENTTIIDGAGKKKDIQGRI